jgi:hypothetical protein
MLLWLIPALWLSCLMFTLALLRASARADEVYEQWRQDEREGRYDRHGVPDTTAVTQRAARAASRFPP